ncbi:MULTISPECIES: hypothetical protein [Bacteria]|uniref:Uncharacterized protein n=1 Tax=Geotoga petraea TaxID=28234 RepID=A0A1G6HVG7_9BACT|nr:MULTISPECIES: hypothetical protein [Bacteria]MDK2945324.1 hypothetical protein [Geotoga sp.]PUU88929.1 MAG: hypothetical protein CI949_2912 [Halanaerobium sp.]SDB98211.1 hypothetical protein SAMN04488588_0137 [Geotoga petraea]
MKYINKILELVSTIGTPSFHSLLGELLITETKSSKLLIVRNIEKSWVILDAQDVTPKKLEFNDLEELLQEYPDLFPFEFSFSTFILCDGRFEDENNIQYLNNAFAKEENLYEKNRLETVIDRLSYQLSAIKSLVLNLSEPLKEDDFIEIIQSTLSEMLFGGVYTYKISGMQANLFSKIGFYELDWNSICLDEILLSTVEMGSILLLEDVDGLDAYKDKKIKAVFPVGSLENDAYLIFILRDTFIEQEERLFISTIHKIIEHFYIKQFLELIDFKEQINLKTLRLFQIFDKLLEMLKDPTEIENKFVSGIKNLSEVHSLTKYDHDENLPVGVYSNKEIEDIKCDFLIIYPSEENIEHKKEMCINLNESIRENNLELMNLFSLILESYETLLNIDKEGI